MQKKLHYAKVTIISIIAISYIILINHNEFNVYAYDIRLDEIMDNDRQDSNSLIQNDHQVSKLADIVINVTDSILIDLKKTNDALKNGNNTETKMYLNEANQKLLEMKEQIKLQKNLSESISAEIKS